MLMIRRAAEVTVIMGKTLSRASILALIMACSALLMVAPIQAGDTLLSNNRGIEDAVFYIEGEPSAVINGFDLTPLGLQLPVALDAVRIDVAKPAQGASSELLVYQDGNGGSPIDATLVHRQTVFLAQAGLNRIELSQAAIITEPVVWVGFNLPVGFEFHADTSGPSVLTYWAWTPGGSFDLSSLSSAAVLGPGDGSAPVNIAMDGIARITAELRTAETREMAKDVPLGRQIRSTTAQDTSIMQPYGACPQLLFDPEDIRITANNAFSLDCYIEDGFHAPSPVQHMGEQSVFVYRKGPLYKLDAQIPQRLQTAGAVHTLPEPVTHCLNVPEEDRDSATIGEIRARAAPTNDIERWNILPTVRFGDLICAEVTVANYLSYFVEQTTESTQAVNLVVGWTEIWPHPLYCGVDARVYAPVVNTGQSWFDTEDHTVTITVRNVHVSSGIVTDENRIHVGPSQLGPGARQFIDLGHLNVDVYLNELHRVDVFVDSDNEVEEVSEDDNYWSSEYIMTLVPGREVCGAASLNFKFRGCAFWFTQDYKGDDPAIIAALKDLQEAVRYANVPTQAEEETKKAADPNYSVLEEIRNRLRGAVSHERWELIENWFFKSRSEIVHTLAPIIYHNIHIVRGGPDKTGAIPDSVDNGINVDSQCRLEPKRPYCLETWTDAEKRTQRRYHTSYNDSASCDTGPPWPDGHTGAWQS